MKIHTTKIHGRADKSQCFKGRLADQAVISVLTYRCESWFLTQDVMKKLNGCNSQMLARITGRGVHNEANSTTSSFDVVKHIRVRRLRWLGEILRGDRNRLLFHAMETQYSMKTEGNMFMDVPHRENFADLLPIAEDKTYWRSLESIIPSHLRETTVYTER